MGWPQNKKEDTFTVSSFADIESVRLYPYAGVPPDPLCMAGLVIANGVSQVAECHSQRMPMALGTWPCIGA